MTDKQIIIDGVDVSGCECLLINKDKQLCCCIKSDLFGGIEFVKNAKNGNCKENPNCYYKQLKRKEQECEELKRDNATLFDKAIEARKECTDLKEQLFLLKIDYTELEKRHNDSFEQFNQLKTELEQMTALKDTYFACYHAKHEDLAKKYDQLKAENETLKQYKASKQASYEEMQKRWNDVELENRKLKQTLTKIAQIAKDNWDKIHKHRKITFVPAGPPTLLSKYFWLEKRRKNERIR